MQFRDRIRELRRVAARSLRPHPRNWRLHPPEQQAALRGILADVGYADALLVRECDDGSLELIDGHSRAETTPDQLVPVLVLDVTAEEAERILLTHDPLAGMAACHDETFQSLLANCSFESEAVQRMLGQGASQHAREESPEPTVQIPELFQVVVTCESEAAQQELFEEQTARGRSCRLLSL
jgi:hypothetical protein